VAVAALVLAVATGEPVTYSMAGWDAPLGIELLLDPLSAAMMAMTAVITLAVTGLILSRSRLPELDSITPVLRGLVGRLRR